jgi:TolB protein
MRNASYCLSLPFAAFLACSGFAAAQAGHTSAQLLLAGSTDIGSTLQGSTVSGPASGTFRITGGGADMWGTQDAFRFGWIRLAGDATLSADVHFGPGTAHLAKGVLIFRETLEPDSPYADVAIHGDGHVTLQYRAASSAETKDITAPEQGATRIRIERKGGQFITSTKAPNGSWKVFAAQTVALHGPVYVGLGVCAHDAQGLVTATFSQAKLKHLAQVLPVTH